MQEAAGLRKAEGVDELRVPSQRVRVPASSAGGVTQERSDITRGREAQPATIGSLAGYVNSYSVPCWNGVPAGSSLMLLSVDVLPARLAGTDIGGSA